MTSFIAIDPGPESSAVLYWNYGTIHRADILDNMYLLKEIARKQGTLVLEMIASYGMPVGEDVFETCVWIGRFMQAFGGETARVYRKDVKLHLCGSPRAKDSNIRQALIDRFGPGKEKAIGTKKAPGPLYGFKSDMWAALGVAVTYADKAA